MIHGQNSIKIVILSENNEICQKVPSTEKKFLEKKFENTKQFPLIPP